MGRFVAAVQFLTIIPAPWQERLARSAEIRLAACGIRLARQFRDDAGKLNQEAAEAAAEVYWMVFGIALKVK